MDTQIITTAAEASLAGRTPYPQIVATLIDAGVEYYHVDFAALRKHYYSGAGAVVTTAITYEGMPPVAEDFDAVALRANLLDSLQKNQPYREFARRAMAAGVQTYYAFLRGRRVIYIGRQGDHHVEWFPGAEPNRVER